jgi:hypothetical protein
MKLLPLDFKLNPNAGSELRLQSGDSVIVKVIKRLTGNKWAVGIRGRVLPAFSEVELAPGQRLKALVSIRQGRITLKISEQPRNPIQELLLRQGMQPDRILEQIVTAFLRSGLSLAPERLQQARQLLQKFKLDPRKFARMVAIMLEKGIDLRSQGLDRLLPLLGYGEQEPGGGEGRKRRMNRDPQELVQQLRREIEQPENEQASGLQVFNHLKGSTSTWVIIPFDYTYESSGRIRGTIRLRYDPVQQQTDRLIVVTRSETGERWSFVLDHAQGVSGSKAVASEHDSENDGPERNPELSIFSTPAEKPRGVSAELDVLRLKLQNLGIKTDDTIRGDQDFDGFDLPWEELSYRNVDTVH